MGRMEISMQPRLEQRLKMAPQIIQSIEILQLPLLALQERIEQEQLENPVLETEELAEPELGREAPGPLTKAEAAEQGDQFTKVEAISEDYHDYFSQTVSRRAPSGDERDEKLDAIQNTPGPKPSLREHLTEQLRFLDISERQREVCGAIVNNLDRDGRLSCAIEEIVESLDRPVSVEEAHAALAVVQQLDPPGVGARNLVECLLLQLDPNEADFALEREIVLHHLQDIEANRFAKIAEETKQELEAVQRAVASVCMLHPAPGRLYDNEIVPTVAPDVHVELVDDRYEIHLEDLSLPRLHISRQYREMLSEKGVDVATRQFLQKKMESARWLIDAIQQRRRTLLKVSSNIVRAQQEFFENGLSHLRPLKMQDVADAVGIHVATVSRAIRHKYMETPRGLLPMKFFFTGGTKSTDSGMQTWDAVRERIKGLVEAEDKANPLSDLDIVEKLGQAGIHIARRTVTKYRKALRISSSRQRRNY